MLCGIADVSGDQTLQLGLTHKYMSTVANICKLACALWWSISSCFVDGTKSVEELCVLLYIHAVLGSVSFKIAIRIEFMKFK